MDEEESNTGEESPNTEEKWFFLQHKGPIFAPPYKRLPPEAKFYYDGKVICLSDEAEEVATIYSKMLDHAYTTKDVFNRNFFEDWRKTMTDDERKQIKELKKCNFKEIAKYARKNWNPTTDEMEAHGVCTIDGREEKISNYKINSLGLFRGRGEHPKMGKLKRRVQPEDITINCSADSEIPQPPAGHKWKSVIQNQNVSWLASWTENVQNQVKYMMLSKSSKLKGKMDWKKYEKARSLHELIQEIRRTYMNDLDSKDVKIKQRAVALYFIDNLSLRAGNKKDENQADTVGCCSLRIEHISLQKRTNVVVLDFLGKDSIQYYKKVPVEERVFKNLQLFMETTSPEDDLFPDLNPSILNNYLKRMMNGLTAKVFRTYNASCTFEQELNRLTDAQDSEEGKIISYKRANRAAAILCNHRRSVSKSHEKRMNKLKKEIDAKRKEVEDAEKNNTRQKKALKKLKKQLRNLEIEETECDKIIALSSSKQSYLDPRISVAWCKKHNVPIEKIYNKSERERFDWAIETAGPDFSFVSYAT